jgi:hypothetical protein
MANMGSRPRGSESWRLPPRRPVRHRRLGEPRPPELAHLGRGRRPGVVERFYDYDTPAGRRQIMRWKHEDIMRQGAHERVGGDDDAVGDREARAKERAEICRLRADVGRVALGHLGSATTKAPYAGRPGTGLPAGAGARSAAGGGRRAGDIGGRRLSWVCAAASLPLCIAPPFVVMGGDLGSG